LNWCRRQPRRRSPLHDIESTTVTCAERYASEEGGHTTL